MRRLGKLLEEINYTSFQPDHEIPQYVAHAFLERHKNDFVIFKGEEYKKKIAILNKCNEYENRLRELQAKCASCGVDLSPYTIDQQCIVSLSIAESRSSIVRKV